MPKASKQGQSNAVCDCFLTMLLTNCPIAGGSFINTEPGFPESTGEDIEISVVFENPIDPELLGTVPFNPFIFIDGERGKELHLKGPRSH